MFQGFWIGSVGCSRSEPSAIALLVHLLERAVASFPNRLLGLSNFDIKFQISTMVFNLGWFVFNSVFLTAKHPGFHLTRDWCNMCHRWKRAFALPVSLRSCGGMQIGKATKLHWLLESLRSSWGIFRVASVLDYASIHYNLGIYWDYDVLGFGCSPWR